jgi:hypothetical protein
MRCLRISRLAVLGMKVRHWSYEQQDSYQEDNSLPQWNALNQCHGCLFVGPQQKESSGR